MQRRQRAATFPACPFLQSYVQLQLGHVRHPELGPPLFEERFIPWLQNIQEDICPQPIAALKSALGIHIQVQGYSHGRGPQKNGVRKDSGLRFTQLVEVCVSL